MADKTRAGVWLSEEDRAVTEWDAGAVEIAAAIFGSDLVRDGLGLLQRMRLSQWWGRETGTGKPGTSPVLQRNRTADLVTRVAAQMEDELRHGGDRAQAELRKAIKLYEKQMQDEVPGNLPPD